MGKRSKRWMGIFGFGGFGGVLYFYTCNEFFLLMFMFFSFFSFYIVPADNKWIDDETLVRMNERIIYWCYRIAYGVSIVLMIVITDKIIIKDFEIKYSLLVGGWSVIFSLMWIAYSVILRIYINRKDKEIYSEKIV